MGLTSVEQLDTLCSFTVPAILLEQNEGGALQHVQTWLYGLNDLGTLSSTCQGGCTCGRPCHPKLWDRATYELKRTVQRICL